MILRLRNSHSDAEEESVLTLARELGYQPRFLDHERRLLELVLPSVGSPRTGDPADRSLFEDLSAVQGVLDGEDAPELFRRTPERGDTIVQVREARFGGAHVAVVAGPCAVEHEDDLLEVARAVKSSGATLLRGGAFKPRTSPYSFQGVGEAGLESLDRVRSAVGIGIVTEVLDPRDVDRVAAVADMLQVGSRSMSNAALLREVGRSDKPVLLKRGLAATAREFLLAAEHVLAAGNPDVVLCERGIRGFDDVTRNVLDLGTLAYLRHHSHLPVIVDPSHAAGRPELIQPLSKAGIAAGADGLIVEVHPRPASVHSDGAQAISPAAFEEIVRSVEGITRLDGRTLCKPRVRTMPAKESV